MHIENNELIIIIPFVTFANVLECGGSLNGSSDQISFSSQHYNLSISTVCAWTITVPGHSIELTLWSLAAESGFYDYDYAMYNMKNDVDYSGYHLQVIRYVGDCIYLINYLKLMSAFG